MSKIKVKLVTPEEIQNLLNEESQGPDNDIASINESIRDGRKKLHDVGVYLTYDLRGNFNQKSREASIRSIKYRGRRYRRLGWDVEFDDSDKDYLVMIIKFKK